MLTLKHSKCRLGRHNDQLTSSPGVASFRSPLTQQLKTLTYGQRRGIGVLISVSPFCQRHSENFGSSEVKADYPSRAEHEGLAADTSAFKLEPSVESNGRSNPTDSGMYGENSKDVRKQQHSDDSLAEEGGMPHRWRVVLMMALAFVLCNMDKVNMSVAVIPMAHELGWSALDRGLVSSSFFWGYTATQLPGGYVATKIGGAKVLFAGVVLWSLGTLIAPPMAHMGILWLCASRALVGLGEGVAPSAATTVLARLMPSNERSRAVSLVWGGLDVGSAVGLLLSGPLIRMYGWPCVFYLFAVLGIVWSLLWPFVKKEGNTELNKPPKDNEVPLPSDKAASFDVPWGQVARSPPVWAVTVAHFCFNWGYYSLLAWLPSYFELALGLTVEKSSIATLIPYMAMIGMMPLVGPVADGMVEKGVPLTKVRKICQGISFLGPAVCMVGCALLTPMAAGQSPLSTPVVMLVVLMSFAFALSAWSRAGLYCNHQDLSPRYAGALLGITNTAGAIPGVLGVTAVGYLLDATNSWAIALFYPAAICQVTGAIVYTMLASSRRQPWS